MAGGLFSLSFKNTKTNNFGSRGVFNLTGTNIGSNSNQIHNNNLFNIGNNSNSGIVSWGNIRNKPTCFTPCVHSIDLVTGTGVGYAYWNGTAWSFSSLSNYIASIADTSTIDLNVSIGGELTAAFASMNISQFTNNSGYITSSALSPYLTISSASSTYQPIGSYLTNVTGTSNRITSTGGINPVIDISSSYVGQNTINTLGTITTGTWNGSLLTGTYGGTGVNNGTRVLTYAGNVTFTGTNNVSFTTVGTYTYTLPNATTFITGSTAALTANVIPYVTSNGLIADSIMTWDNTNRYLYGSTSLRIGLASNNAIDWTTSTTTITAATTTVSSTTINLTAAASLTLTTNTNGFNVRNGGYQSLASTSGLMMLNDRTVHVGNILSTLAFGSTFIIQGVGGALSGALISYHPNANITGTTSGSSTTLTLSGAFTQSGRVDQLSQGDRIEFWDLPNTNGASVIIGTRNNIIATASNTLSLTLGTAVNHAIPRYMRIYRALMKVYDYSGVMKFHMTNDGLVGIGLNTAVSPTNAIVFPTALLHLGGGTTTIAPLQFTSSALKTSNNLAGDVQFLTDDYYVTITTGTAVHKLARCLSNTATLDFGSTAAGAVTDLTITVTGAVSGDAVALSVPNGSQPATGSFSAWVSAVDTVTVRYANNSLTTAQDPASGTFKVIVFKN